MKTIIIDSPAHGIKTVLVDDEDFENVNRFRWGVTKNGNKFYAKRGIFSNGKWTSITMHKMIMGVNLIDHKNNNGLDNQRHNLRQATSTQNNCNKLSRGVSKYLGVHIERAKHKKPDGTITVYEKWCAKIRVNGERIFLGLFKDEIQAAHAYDVAARKYHGEFANPNFTTMLALHQKPLLLHLSSLSSVSS